MKKIFLTMAAAALVLGFTACSSEDTTTTTTDMDTNMNTVSPVITTPSDNTGEGIEGGGMNAGDTAIRNNNGAGNNSGMNTTGGSGASTNAGNRNAQGGSNSSGIMGPGTNVTNTGNASSGTSNRNTNNANRTNDPDRFQAGPDVKTPAVSNSQRGGNEVIEKANERNDRSDRVNTPKDVNPRTGLAPVR